MGVFDRVMLSHVLHSAVIMQREACGSGPAGEPCHVAYWPQRQLMAPSTDEKEMHKQFIMPKKKKDWQPSSKSPVLAQLFDFLCSSSRGEIYVGKISILEV